MCPTSKFYFCSCGKNHENIFNITNLCDAGLHYDHCRLLRGIETRNLPIRNRRISYDEINEEVEENSEFEVENAVLHGVAEPEGELRPCEVNQPSSSSYHSSPVAVRQKYIDKTCWF